MKLYIKGERRYREAKDSEVLFAAAEVMARMGITRFRDIIEGAATVLEVQEKKEVKTEILRRAKQEEKP